MSLRIVTSVAFYFVYMYSDDWKNGDKVGDRFGPTRLFHRLVFGVNFLNMNMGNSI